MKGIMKNQKSSEEFIVYLTGVSAKMIFDDWMWQIFGFKKRPKRGAFFNRFISSEKLMREKFILRELFISGLANGISSLPESCSPELRLKLAARAIDLIISYEGVVESFGFNSAHEACLYLGNNLGEYLNSNHKEFGNIFLMHAQQTLGELFQPVWLVGIARIFSDMGSQVKCISTIIKEKYNFPLEDDITLNNPDILSYIKK